MMLKWFRLTGTAEGLSFLVLLGISMPLKYWAGMPEAVKINGWIHGVLFVLYVAAIAAAAVAYRWSILRVLGAFVAAFVPFGPFIFDRTLRKDK